MANQLSAEEAYAQRFGIDVVATFSDNDISATKGRHRPGYTALIEAVKRGEIDIIIVWHTSRLWRNRRERAEGIEILKEAGVSIMAVKGPSLDMSTAYGRGMAEIIGAFDTIEVEIKGERQQLAAQGRARDGLPPLGKRLTGYTTGGEIIESEAEAIRTIFARFHAGDSIRGVVAHLNDTGVPTRTGRPWTPSSVRTILINPRYAGRVVYNRSKGETEWTPAKSPAIVAEHVWDAVNARLADPRRKTAHNTDRKYLGSSLYQCGICGRLVRAQHLGGRPGYRCPNGCLQRTGAAIDRAVSGLVRARLAMPDVGQLVHAPMGIEAAAAAAELRKQRGRLEQLERDYDEDLVDGPRYKTKRAKIETELAAAQGRLARVTAGSEVASVLTAVDAVKAYDSSPLGTKQAVIRFFMTVELLPAPRGVNGFRPESLRITPRHPVAVQVAPEETALQGLTCGYYKS